MDPPNGRDEEAALPANPRPQTSRSSVPSFLFISFILFMLTSHSGDEFLARHQYQDALQSLTYQLSNYTSWMNGNSSNFTMVWSCFFVELRMELVLTSALQPRRDTTVPTLLETFHVQGGPLDPNQESYYSNITGFIHGNAVFTNITLPALQDNHTVPWKHHAERFMKDVNTTGMGVRLGSWAWNTSTKLSLSVVEKHTLESQQPSSKSPLVTLIHVRLSLNLLSVDSYFISGQD